MAYGFVRVAAATPVIRVADCLYNAAQIKALMRQAAQDKVQVLAFPELCITGYTCGDLFLQQTLLQGAIAALTELARETKAYSFVCVVGLPVQYAQKLYNCAAVLHRGRILGIVPKQHLPNYGEFYERRHFTAGEAQNGTIVVAGEEVPFGTQLLFASAEDPNFILAVEICEDLWVPNSPSISHAQAGATMIVNPSASDETIGKADYRRQLVTFQSAQLVCAYLYASAGEGESTTDLVFAGHNLIAENGVLLNQSALFENGLTIAEVDLERLAQERMRLSTFAVAQNQAYQKIPFSAGQPELPLMRYLSAYPFVPEDKADRDRRCSVILDMQAAGLRKRIAHTGVKTAVIGISGGLDSTLALGVTVRAMDQLSRPRTDIIALTMPCFGTTSRTKTNAQRLCEALGVTLRTIPITKAVKQHFLDIGHPDGVFDVTYENAQARERTQVLMDIANQTGGLVIGTGDLSELALGWATYNGDHMSMYGVNASVPKTLVRYLVGYMAEQAKLPALANTLRDILDTPVSPELLPAEEGEISQKTEDLIGPYELHDFFLYYLIRFGFTPQKVLFLARHAFRGIYEEEVIGKWLQVFIRRFFAQQFKRSCLPDGPKIGSVTLSPRGDWRMPSDACAALWLRWIEP